LDQFTPERQIKEVVWRLPSLPKFDARHTNALMAWSNEYLRAGVTDFDMLNQLEHRRVTVLDARVQLAFVWASLKNRRPELAARITNDIKNPFYRFHAEVLVSSAHPQVMDSLQFRPEYGEDADVARLLGGALAQAGTAELLTRSAIMFREINFSRKSEFHLFYDSEFQGKDLVQLAVLHSQAWIGEPAAASSMLKSDSHDGQMSRFSQLEFLIAMHPCEDWLERAQAITRQVLLDDGSTDFLQIPDLYGRFGGLTTAATVACELDQPLSDSKHRAFHLKMLEAMRRYGLSKMVEAENPKLEASLDMLTSSNALLDRARLLAQEGRTDEVLELISDQEDHIQWLPQNYVERQIIATLARHGHGSDAQKMTDVMLSEADDLDRDSYLTSDVARDLAEALLETRQYFLARSMTEHVSDTADRLQVHAAILATYTNHLLERGESPGQHYVALYAAKDRELGLRRSTRVEFRLFDGTTW
jgi:hypothetical protein